MRVIQHIDGGYVRFNQAGDGSWHLTDDPGWATASTTVDARRFIGAAVPPKSRTLVSVDLQTQIANRDALAALV